MKQPLFPGKFREFYNIQKSVELHLFVPIDLKQIKTINLALSVQITSWVIIHIYCI